jgi:hypothetical protein
MPRITTHTKSIAARSPEALIQEALSSQDGLVIADLVKKIELTDAPSELIQNALRDLIHAHPEMSPVVIGCLSTLERMKSPELRPVCRIIVNAPFNPDRDLIVAHAASILAQQPNPERVDILLLAKAVDHHSEHVKVATRRALKTIPRELAEKILAGAAELPEKPQLAILKRFASGEDVLSTLTLPPPPRPLRQQPVQSAPAAHLDPIERKEGSIPFSTPIAEALKDKTAVSNRRKAITKRQPPLPKLERSEAEYPDSTIAALLTPHRIEGYHLLSDSALTNTIIISKDYREVAGALAEYTLRKGAEKAREYNGRLVYALSDITNTEKARFGDIARVWYGIS